MKYKIPLVLFGIVSMLFIINVTIALAEPVDPSLNYYSNPPFEVDEYNTSLVIENAIEMGYAVKIEIDPGIYRDYNGTIYKGNPGGGILVTPPIYEFINAENEQSFLQKDKRLYINYPDIFSQIKVIEDDLNFGVSAELSISKKYSLRTGFSSDKSDLTVEEANDIIVNELKDLGILPEDENITIQFESYLPPVPVSNSNGQQFQFYTLPILIIAGIVVIIILTASRRFPK